MKKTKETIETMDMAEAPPEAFKRVGEAMRQLKALRFLDHNEWRAKYLTSEEARVIDKWDKINGKCHDARRQAMEAIKYHGPTVADGLPPEFAALETAHAKAKAIHEEWDIPWKLLWTLATDADYYDFDRGDPVVALAREAADEAHPGREASYDVLSRIQQQMEPKLRHGSRVQRVRQLIYNKIDQQRDRAGQAAYEAAMKRLGGHEAQRAADTAKAAAEARQETDIAVLVSELKAAIRAYLKT